MKPLLTLQNINHAYIDGNTRRQVLFDVNCTFEKGKLYAILGASGSGKTTLLSLMAGLDHLQSGTILYEDKEINQIGLTNYRKNLIALVFQQYNLLTYLSAVDNLLFVMDETTNTMPHNKKAVAYELLNQFGIVKTKADRLVTKLSGGEQQRVAIARALATNVDLILADEPTGNLDAETAVEMMKIFRMLAEEYHKTVIIVTHSSKMANLCDIQIHLNRGRLAL